MVLWGAYTAKATGYSLGSLDPVLLAWAVFTLACVVFIQYRVFHYLLTVYLLLGTAFFIGLVVDGMQLEQLWLSRSLFSQLVLSIVSAVALQKIALSSQLAVSRKWIDSLDAVVIVTLLFGVWFVAQAQFQLDHAVSALLGDNYLTLSDLLAMLVLVSMSRPGLALLSRALWMGLGFTGLMLLGSRAALVFFGVAAIVAMSSSYSRNGRARMAGVVFAAVVLTGAVAFFFKHFDETITYRVVSLLNLAVDASVGQRSVFFISFLEQLDAAPICLVLPCFVPTGTYVHNILSTHQYFGLIGTLLMAGAFAILAFATFSRWRAPLAPLLIYCLLQLVLARSWFSLVFPVFLAYVALAYIHIKSRREAGSRLDVTTWTKSPLTRSLE